MVQFYQQMSMVFFKFFFVSFIFAALSAATNGGPLYLCDENSQEAHFESEYTALDQCTRWGTAQLQHNSFALRFQLTGKCENGILICYPGSLDPSGTNSAYGMRPEIQFQVSNLPESKVGQQCLAYQKNCNKDNGASNCNTRGKWHGIRVSAPKAFGGGTLIELSISKEKYKLGKTKILNIEFGNPKNLRTKVTDESGKEIKFGNDDSIQEAYLGSKIKRDAKLGNYSGLWMLGLDFLPMLNQNFMEMHVFLDCGCEMHAWFVHPPDEMPPVRSEPPAVSADCPTNARATAEHFALPMPAEIGRAVLLRQRLNKNPEDLELRFGNEMEKHLLVLHVENPPYGLINISSKGNHGNDQRPEEGGEEEEAVETKEKMWSSGVVGRQFKTFDSDENNGDEWVDKYLEVELAVHKYHYEVKVGDRKSVAYFPKYPEWWMENKMLNITRIEVSGDVYPSSIDEPKVKQKPKYDQSKFRSYTKRFEDTLDTGDIIVIRGKTGRPAKANKGMDLSFFLMHNSPAFNHYVSKVGWFLFQRNGSLTMGHYNFVEKFVAAPLPQLDLFKPNEPFEMRIQMIQSEGDTGIINITICTPNGTEETTFELKSMTFRDINFINIVGAIELFEAPYVLLPDNDIKRKKKSYRIFPLLVAGDSIRLEGKLKDDASFLNIELLHDSPVSNPYFGNVVMQLIFKLDIGQMFLNSYINNLLFETNDLMKSFPSKVFPGEEFKIEIRVEFNEYKIFVYGAFVASYEHILPPWAVSHINFRGTFSYISSFVLDRTKGIFREPSLRSLAIPFVVEIPEQKMLRFGDSITIRGTVTKANANIVVLLLNEAIEAYDSVSPSVLRYLLNGTSRMVGTIVTRAIFSTDLDGKGYIEFSYNDEIELHNLTSPLFKAQTFNLKIVMYDRPVFRLDGYGQFKFKIDTMPVWAIQYIRVEGDLELSEMPRIEFKTKKARHKIQWDDNLY